jgi:N4-gp56 family major capsid protein
MHPYQVTDLRTDASTAGNWFDIQKAALQGGKVSKNPIYTGALGEYNGVIIRSSYDVTQGVHSSTGAAVTTVRRAPFMGAQAAMMAFGPDSSADSFAWEEEWFDYRRELGVSAQSLWGLKKTIFNSVDFGNIVISTYAVAHT